jgi:ectoine hydroxylase-related dioxygenase (phytanoyl-CoA dioxygenase family)
MPLIELELFWKQTLHSDSNFISNENNIWNKALETLYRLGISMEDTVRYLHYEKPDLNTFQIWISDHSKETMSVEEEPVAPVLSEEDLDFWEENGYVIIKEAITRQDCADTQNAIWNFLNMNPDVKETWYQGHEAQKGLMLQFFDHETLNKNRCSAKIKKAYEQLYQTTAIYKTIDKVSFNPPETTQFRFSGSPLHWDVSLKLPISTEFQGLLYLTDCAAADGAFHCVAGFHKKIESWLNSLAPGENPREKALKTLQPAPVPGNAGDFVIWKNTLPHCATPNHGSFPRMVQYLTYLQENRTASPEWI